MAENGVKVEFLGGKRVGLVVTGIAINGVNWVFAILLKEQAIG